MKNYKKVVAMVLAVFMLFSLAACGEKKTDESANTTVSDVAEDTAAPENESEEEKLPHEIVAEFEDEQLGSNSVLLKEKLGRNFGAVYTGSNFGSHFNEEELYGEMSFDDEVNGNYVTARMMRATSTTVAADIFHGFPFGWENAADETVYDNVTAKVLRTTTDEGEIVGAYWTDEDVGLVYGIIVGTP